jgi:hypothetical protein
VHCSGELCSLGEEARPVLQQNFFRPQRGLHVGSAAGKEAATGALLCSPRGQGSWIQVCRVWAARRKARVEALSGSDRNSAPTVVCVEPAHLPTVPASSIASSNFEYKEK